MIFSDYFDSSNDTLPPTSPLLQPVQPRLKPEAPDESDDDTDIEDVVDLELYKVFILPQGIPWNPALRDRKRPRGTKPDRLRKKRRDAGWKDWSLIHNMSANDPEIARAAAREYLPPDDPDIAGPPVSRKLRRPRKRRVLPLAASGSLGIARVFHACADSGSDENIISLDVVRQMQLDVEPNSTKEFALANGKIVKAAGFVKLDCRFEVGTPLPSTTLACVFYVFNTLAVPMIIGMDFLMQTETLTKHTDRLIEQVVSDMQVLRVNSIGTSKQSAPCRLNDYNGYTVIDTGSDLNFIHPNVLEQGHFDLELASVDLEFADCSVGRASGLIDVTFAIGHDDGPHSLKIPMEPVREEFYVLDDLNMDVLIGHDTIESLGVMTAHHDSLLNTYLDSGVNIIRAIGKLERRFKTFLTDISPKLGRNSDTTVVPSLSAELETQRINAQQEEILPASPILGDASATRKVFHLPTLTIEITRPAHSRPSSEISISSMNVETDNGSSTNDRPLQSESLTVGYTCPIPECNSAPFRTEYLLNSHMHIHQSARPYFCNVAGCPRSEGGKGFKRRNEMIRHCLVHDSPGYTCPFCPDQEHRYPRPDNLQRHVRVHHVDKDKDDLLLRDALTQGFSTRRSRHSNRQ